jgi:Concanavalin A-like lectin/glucanases superfamily
MAMAILLLPSALPAATNGYQAQVTQSAPVLYYQFNEASGAAVNYGSLGADYNATYFGAPTRQAPTQGGDTGVAFATGSDYLESLGVAPAEFTGNPTFSAEALFFVPINGHCSFWAPFLHWGPSPADSGGPTAKSVYFSFSNADPTSAFAGFYNGGPKSATGSMPLGHWHHFVWVRIGGGTALVGTTVYIDGKNVSATLVADPALPADGLTPIVGATEFRTNRARDIDGSRYFTGTLDEVALYDRALTATRRSTKSSRMASSRIAARTNGFLQNPKSSRGTSCALAHSILKS